MATYDSTEAHKTSSSIGGAGVQVLRRRINTADNNRAQNDIDQLFDVSAGDFVLKAFANVQTAEGGTLTFDVGDGSDVDGYVDGQDGNTTGYAAPIFAATASTGATPTITMTGYTGGKLYTAADTVDVKWLNAADAAIVDFYLVVSRGIGPA